MRNRSWTSVPHTSCCANPRQPALPCTQVAPSAFVNGAAAPDQVLLLQQEEPALQLVSCLIELQLYHLQRARALVAHARQHPNGTATTAAA